MEQMTRESLEMLYGGGCVALSLLLVFGIMFALYRFGGWYELSKKYGVPSGQINPQPMTMYTWRSCIFRYWIGYNSCLKMGADHKGIYMGVMPLFKWIVWGHKDLFFPWGSFNMEDGRVIFNRPVKTFQFLEGPNVKLSIPHSYWEEFRKFNPLHR